MAAVEAYPAMGGISGKQARMRQSIYPWLRGRTSKSSMVLQIVGVSNSVRRLRSMGIKVFYPEYDRDMGATTKTLYETDFVEWCARTAELLRERRFDEVDLENLVEEVERSCNRRLRRP